jgi:acetyl-CoA carboxylase biotin carboxyl carrier protein
MQIALEQLEALLKTLDEKKVAEFEYEDEKLRLRIALGRVIHAVTEAPAASALASHAANAAATAAAESQDVSIAYITSPFVGTFYRASSPDADNFVEVGSSAKKGQPLCIVEAMKLMNEIEADDSCTILEILVDNGKSVEFGQKLFKIKKT